MKVLHVIESIDKSHGGLPFALFNLLEMERLIGVSSSVLTVFGTIPENFEDVDFFIFPTSFPARLRRSIVASEWLKSNINRFNLLIFHSTWNLLCQECARISLRRQVPYVVWPHGSLDPFDLKKRTYLKKFLGPLFIKSYLRHSLHLCVTATEEARRLQTYGANPKVEILALPVNVNLKLGDREGFRKKYGFKQDDFVFLFLSRIDYKKGLDTLLFAFEKIANTQTNIFLILAGPDSNGYLGKMLTLVKTLKLEDKVTYVGPLSHSEKAEAFKGSDCFILPSQNENFGISIVESLQYGLPVVISDNVYISQEVADGGWVCEATVEAVQKVLAMVIDNKLEYQKRRERAKYIGANFTPQNLKKIYETIYFKKE